MRRFSGFTLIELMIALAILAIIGAFALPAYSDYVRRARLTEAFAWMANYKAQMDQYYSDNRRFSKVQGGADCGITVTAPGKAAGLATTDYFAYSCQMGADDNGFTAQAIGIRDTSMMGFNYTLLQDGSKRTWGVSPQWTLPPGPVECWVVKKDGSC